MKNIQLCQASIVSLSIAVSHKGSNLFLFFVEKQARSTKKIPLLMGVMHLRNCQFNAIPTV